MGVSYWDKCNEEFAYEKTIKVTKEQVLMIYKKLCRHYKMPMIHVRFNRRSYNGAYYGRTRHIELPSNEKYLDLWFIIHELGHYYDHFKRGWIMRKRGKRYHTKKLFTKEKRLMNYCRKKNYWGIDHGWKQYQDEGGSMSKEHYLERIEELRLESLS